MLNVPNSGKISTRDYKVSFQLHFQPKDNNVFVMFYFVPGYGGLSLSIEGPSKADIECTDNEDGSCRVTYKPTEPGTYIINIKFADEHVPGMYSTRGETSSKPSSSLAILL